MKLLYLPFILQGLAMFVDELYFHEKRGLLLWERVGHPLDTLTVLSCYAYLLWGSGQLSLYLVLCGFSCLCITKDEFIHVEKCSGTEHWLHAMLFILHPVSFLAAYWVWQAGDVFILKLQMSMIFIFMLYQILRWSFSWRIQAK